MHSAVNAAIRPTVACASRRRQVLILWCVSVCVCATACGQSAPETDTTASASPPQRPFRPGIRFAPDTPAGTRIGDLIVDSIRLADPTAGRDAGIAYFRGEMTLAGQTLRHFDADLALTSVCFEADSASAARMPRWEGDERRPWFCFTNGTEAGRRLAPPGEVISASIVIDRFTIHRAESDVVNSARLVRVLPAPAPRR